MHPGNAGVPPASPFCRAFCPVVGGTPAFPGRPPLGTHHSRFHRNASACASRSRRLYVTAHRIEVRLRPERPPQIIQAAHVAVPDADDRENEGVGLVEGGAGLLVGDGHRVRVAGAPDAPPARPPRSSSRSRRARLSQNTIARFSRETTSVSTRSMSGRRRALAPGSTPASRSPATSTVTSITASWAGAARDCEDGLSPVRVRRAPPHPCLRFPERQERPVR